MFDQVRNWIMTMGVLLLVVSISEMALPKGSMRKYLRFLTGLLVIQAMVSPIAAWLRDMPGSIEGEVSSFMESARVQHAATREGDYKEIVLDTYRRSITDAVIAMATQAGMEQPTARVVVGETGVLSRIVVYDGVSAASGLGGDEGALALRKEIAQRFGLGMEAVLVR